MKVPLDHKPALELGERNMSMHGNGKVEKVEGGSGNTEGKGDEVRITADPERHEVSVRGELIDLRVHGGRAALHTSSYLSPCVRWRRCYG